VHGDKPSKIINPGHSALLIIDLQQALFTRPTPVYKAETLLENILFLANQAHQQGVPVFYLQHSEPELLVKGSPGWQLHPRLNPLATDTIIHKLHDNAFESTSLDQELKAKNITTLVITGLLTHCCVKATSLGARRVGYSVILVKDGHSNYSRQAPRIIEKWNQKLAAQQVEVILTSQVDFTRMLDS
jgi:nicotinamidase-related amidase